MNAYEEQIGRLEARIAQLIQERDLARRKQFNEQKWAEKCAEVTKLTERVNQLESAELELRELRDRLKSDIFALRTRVRENGQSDTINTSAQAADMENILNGK